ncbi:ribose-5-phosphate isomerase RpiA [Alicyclobacillus sp. SO9]|uniref:ribose-5-phosphate isomerase RpiA n=1 Tax=Alicyclobacillus sp. SO9 TaxID=2665646 RepID=UPI0018E776D0|nr:ribose-5-phosphate isomerase RpiA [Alicyclobacillus sp. SO9]QQE77295.1 ribose-5-phosphate isomerase RpiA [Alicyclobacillus sp. SO9]
MDAKRLAGEKAVEYVEDGMILGLGTGSTVYWSILKLAEFVQRGLTVSCVATSKKTEVLATELGIQLRDIFECRGLDLTIDGADEIDENFNLIKGGGGALFREKMVASISRRFIVVVDDSKCVSTLGRFVLPVEIVQFGWNITSNRVAELDCVPKLRMEKDVPFVTDNGNYILDCTFNTINDPQGLDRKLNAITGVVDNGLFVGMADTAIVGGQDSVIAKVNNTRL